METAGKRKGNIEAVEATVLYVKKRTAIILMGFSPTIIEYGIEKGYLNPISLTGKAGAIFYYQELVDFATKIHSETKKGRLTPSDLIQSYKISKAKKRNGNKTATNQNLAI